MDFLLVVCVCEYGLLRGCFFFQAEDGIRDLVRSRGLGDVYKRQVLRVVGVVRRGVEDGVEVDDRDAQRLQVVEPLLGLSLIHI